MAVTARDLAKPPKTPRSDEGKEESTRQNNHSRRMRSRRSSAPGRDKQIANERSANTLSGTMKTRVLVALGILLLMMLALVVSRAIIVTRVYELSQAQDQLRQARAEIDRMRSEIAAMDSTRRVSTIATSELGMVAPEDEQPSSVEKEVQVAFEDSPQQVVVGTQDGDSESSKNEEPEVVVLNLDSTDHQGAVAGLQDLGWWLLRWLRGDTPARAGQ